ncbi:YDG domain-containing protein, partial [Polaromonas sp.]|uniref:beta strand repeat-containing protein n=1 Tax=Polaromonas sp. TaxID=1869339 RepID=UPI003266FA52
NGILFGAGAQVNVGGLVASTLDIKDADLSSSQRSFSGPGTGSVVNQGRISATPGGYVALLGNIVSNQGSISAPLGSVVLGAGSAATLTFQDNQLLKVVVDQSVLNSLAENGGLIQADGGRVLMSAGARDSLQASVVNNSGVIQARTVENRNGTIILLGGMAAGTANVAGTLDASAPNGGNGGFIETSGAHVNVANSARITTAALTGTTGTWLIDPVDFTIAASGGNMTGAALSTALGVNNFVVQSTDGNTGTAGDINVNDVVSWSANQLTLSAQNNININANLNASGTGKLALEYGQGTANGAANGTANTYNFNNGAKINLPAGNNFSTKQGSTGTPVVYTVITDLGTATSATGTDLQGISGNLNGRYALGADIDASPTSTWNAGNGFTPLGNSTTQFTGTLDGLGHTVNGLSINRPTADDIGLFGRVNNFGRINNLGLVGGNVSGQFRVGALVGWNLGKIYNSYTDNTPVTSGGSVVGGLVGLSQGSITNSHASSAVSGGSYVGGLVGWGQDVIINSYATGNVTASGERAGGLVGDMLNSGAISGSYASGNVSSTGGNVGGLVGSWNSNGAANAAISNSYATGAVTGTDGVGGLVGHKFSAGGTVNNSYAAGSVSGASNTGGLVGLWDAGTGINNSFWDRTTTGQPNSSGGGTAMTTAEMQQQANFSSATAANGNVNPNWDFASVWRIYEGNSRPLLKALMKATTVAIGNTSKTYDRLAWNGGTGISCSNVACGSLSGSISFSGTAQGAVNAGSYTVTGSGLYSNQQGYDISYANGSLTINPASLAVTGVSAANKVYDAGPGATLNGTASVTAIAGDTVSVAGTGSGTFGDKNVGNGKAVTVTGYTLGGADAGNYVIVQPTGLTASITPASLVVGGVTIQNKVYNASDAATINGTASVAAFAGDTVNVAGTGIGRFADKNVGNGKVVTVTGYTLGGADAGNYTVVQPTGFTANITPASRAVTGVGADNKVYNASDAATLNGTAGIAAFSGDTVTVSGGSGTFVDKNVGNGKAVTVTGYTLGGADAGNYVITQPTGITANITPASLVVTGVGANNKVYDTTTAATLSGTAAVTALVGDVVAVGGTGNGNFANKNVGNGKVVTVTGYTLSGADAGNYTVVQPTGVTANITPASLTVSGVSANNKVYDTTTTATLSGTAAVTAMVGDVVTVGGGGGNFANKNVGNGKAVTVTGYTLGGADAGNYTVVQPTGLTANITPASLTVSGVGASNKVYDTTATATLNGTASVAAFAGDTVTLGGTGSGTFANKNVGNGKAVTVTGYTISGADAGNYVITQPTGVTANITPASLAVTGVGAANKVFDGTTAATLNGTANVTALGTDVVTVSGSGSGSFANANVGNGKSVTVTGYTLSGADAGNYTAVQPVGLTAAITPAPVPVPVIVTGSASASASATAGAPGRNVDAATQQALNEARAKSEVPEASSTLQVIYSASNDAKDRKDLPVSSPAVERLKDASGTGGKDPLLHIVDGGVRVRRNMFASQE